MWISNSQMRQSVTFRYLLFAMWFVFHRMLLHFSLDSMVTRREWFCKLRERFYRSNFGLVFADFTWQNDISIECCLIFIRVSIGNFRTMQGCGCFVCISINELYGIRRITDLLMELFYPERMWFWINHVIENDENKSVLVLVSPFYNRLL